jgi:uncharacterized RDD family membrane protein YckC
MGTGTSVQFDLGHWILRLIALIIDSIILAIIAGVLLFIFLVPILFTGALYGFAAWGYWLVYPFAIGILSVLYYLVLDVMWGATLGKRALGLEVQTTSGGRINYGQSFIRNISKIHFLLLLLDWVLGVITAGADRRQKYSDRIAGTTVVQVKQAFAAITSPVPPPSQ